MEEDAVMAEMDQPMVWRQRRAAVAKLAASAMESSGFVREGERVGGRARAGEWRGSRASSTSSRLACNTIRASQVHGVHAAATLWPRSAMTSLISTAIRADGAD